MKKVADIYSKIADAYVEAYDCDQTVYPYIDEYLKFVPEGGRILDLGCGTGRITKYYRQKGFNVVGSDLSEGMLRVAKKQNPDTDFKLEDMRDIDYPSGSFDSVSIAWALFHIPKTDVEPLLERIKTIMKPGGMLFLVLQEGEGEVEVDEPLLPEEKIFLALYTEDEIRDLLERAEFEVVRFNSKSPAVPEDFPNNKLFFVARSK